MIGNEPSRNARMIGCRPRRSPQKKMALVLECGPKARAPLGEKRLVAVIKCLPLCSACWIRSNASWSADQLDDDLESGLAITCASPP